MKRTIFSLSLLLMGYCGFSQTISNYSFESSTNPPHYIQQNNAFQPTYFASNWSSPTEGSPDLFTSGTSGCSSNPQGINCYPQICTYENLYGIQNPHTGYRYVGFRPKAEYVQTRISPSTYPNGLSAGACYLLSYWVSRGDNSNKAYMIQAVLSKTDMVAANSNNDALMNLTNDVLMLTPNNYTVNKTGWDKISFYFKATGGEKYLTIGTFVDIVDDPNDPGGLIGTEMYETAAPSDCSSPLNLCAPNCLANFENYCYLDDVELTPVANTQFTNPVVFTNTAISQSYTGSNILITGDVTITGTVTLTNCDVRMNTGASVTLNSSDDVLVLEGSHLSTGCGSMWDGIFVNAGSRIVTKENTNNQQTIIEDAVNAIWIEGSAWQIKNTTFTKNANDIYIEDVTTFPSAYIKGCTFNGNNFLIEQAFGFQGKTANNIRIKNALPGAVPVTIGGTLSGESNTFNGGRNNIIADRNNVNVLSCTFSGGLYAIDFTETTPSTSSTKSLRVTDGCVFSGNTIGVKSYNRTNLTLTGAQFNNVHQAVNWSNNPNCDCIIGDPNIASGLGNSFTGCAFPILMYNNKSVVTSPFVSHNVDLFGGNSQFNTGFTDILIGGNIISGVLGKQTHLGIGVYEYTQGTDIAYHTLRMENNALYDVTKGVELTNVVGMGSMLGYNGNPADNNALNQLLNNFIGINTGYTAMARGFTMSRSPGWKVIANGTQSTEPSNWQNYGIYLENSYKSKIQGNGLIAGTGILIALDASSSNVHCNSLMGNSCGISLANATLRSANVLHGYEDPNNPGNWEAFNNYFTSTMYSWAIEMQNYYSPNNQNKWVWDNTATSIFPRVWNSSLGTYETNLAANSIISPIVNGNPIRGVDNCTYGPLFGGEYIAVPHTEGENISNTLADPIAQWGDDYRYEVVRMNSGLGDSTLVSANIKRIIKIENAISRGNFTIANAEMALLTPSNTVEQNYKNVLRILIDVSYPDMRLTNETEKAELISIAEQNPGSAGLPVYNARAYLKANYLMDFRDEDYTDGKITGVAAIYAPCSIEPVPGTVVTLIDDENNILPLTGAFIESDGSFAFDPFQLRYFESLNPDETYQLIAQSGSAFTVLANEYKTIADWIASSPVSLSLGGALPVLDTLTTTPGASIPTKTTVYDASGNSYVINTTNAPNSNFRLTKYDASNSPVWSKTYDGVSSGNDTATCVGIDDDGFTYVAGKVWNTDHYEFQVVKYSPDGYLTWEVLAADTAARNNKPTGIEIVATTKMVNVVGISIKNNNTKYRRVEFSQCDVDNGNHSQQAQQSTTPVYQEPEKLVEVHPNPSAGTISLRLLDPDGGTLELFNMTGQVVFSSKVINATTINFPEATVTDGIYLLKFTGINGEVQLSKLMIKRDK